MVELSFGNLTQNPCLEGRSAAFPGRPGECVESFHIQFRFATITLGSVWSEH